MVVSSFAQEEESTMAHSSFVNWIIQDKELESHGYRGKGDSEVCIQ